MLGNYLIGLREGLEASLVVSILVAYLVRTSRSGYLRYVWAGVAVAVGLSVAVGALLEFTSASMSFEAQELFGGLMSIVAVVFVTWMIFWMKRAARSIAGELQGRLDSAVAIGGTAVVLVAFISVAREGLETSVFFWTAAKAAESTWTPVLGFSLGLLTAVVLGVLLYRSAVSINLATFFRWTGLLLVFVAAGVLAYGVHDLQEAGALPGLGNLLFDVSAQIPPSSWYGTLLKGVFNFSPATTVLQGVVWIAYVVPCLWLYLRPARTPSRTPDASVAA
jgi:high-affinity iron transporter